MKGYSFNLSTLKDIVEDGITMIKPKIQYIVGQIRISDHVSRKNKHFRSCELVDSDFLLGWEEVLVGPLRLQQVFVKPRNIETVQ